VVPRAVRAVKTGIGVESVGDACGFATRRDGYTRGLIKADSGGRVFHYGWCGSPDTILAKERNLQRFYHDDEWIAQRHRSDDRLHVFERHKGHLRSFTGSHPRVMRDRIAARDWSFDPELDRQGPAWMRSLGIALSYPFSGGADIRSIVPLALSNAGWMALDVWQSLIRRIKKRAAVR